VRYVVDESNARLGLVRPITHTYQVETPLGPLSTVPVSNPDRRALTLQNTTTVLLPTYFPMLDRSDTNNTAYNARYAGGWWARPTPF
jgi:hypothetical protein